MKKVQDIMSTDCKWVNPGTSIREAAELMRDHDFGFLPVGDKEKDKLVGTVTDRDITIRAVAEGVDPEEPVEKIMTNELLYCFDDQSVQEVCDNMGEIQVRRLPVVNRDKRLVGVVSFGDVAQAAQNSEVGQSEQQITQDCANNKKAA